MVEKSSEKMTGLKEEFEDISKVIWCLAIVLVLAGFVIGYGMGSRGKAELERENVKLEEQIDTAYDDIENHRYFEAEAKAEEGENGE